MSVREMAMITKAVEDERAKWLAQSEKDRVRAENDRARLVKRAEAAEADNAALLEIAHKHVVADLVVMGVHPGAALLKELRRLRGLEVAVKEYIRLYGVEHDDPDTVDGDCPQDSTCKCPHILALNAGLAHV